MSIVPSFLPHNTAKSSSVIRTKKYEAEHDPLEQPYYKQAVDLPLMFDQSGYTFAVGSCSPGQQVGQVFAENAVGYSIDGGNPNFSVESSSGILIMSSVPGITTTTNFIVTGRTSSGQRSFVPVTVTTNCNKPQNLGNFGTTSVIFSQSSYQFSTSACLPGAVVGQALAQAAGSSISYAILGGSSYFAINPITGVLTLAQTPPADTWAQSLTVIAISGIGQSSSVTVNIVSSCARNIDGFSQSSYYFTVYNCIAGNIIGRVSAASSTGGVSYFLQNGNPFFMINGATGQITIIQAPPPGMQTFNAQALTGSSRVSIAPVTVNVVSGPPTFPVSFYNFVLSSCTTGMLTGQVTANSCGDQTSYSMIAGGDFFSINQLTGSIFLVGVPYFGLNTLVVQARSSNGHIATVVVNVSVYCSSPRNPLTEAYWTNNPSSYNHYTGKREIRSSVYSI